VSSAPDQPDLKASRYAADALKPRRRSGAPVSPVAAPLKAATPGAENGLHVAYPRPSEAREATRGGEFRADRVRAVDA
jgi:hypothetical protein